jgi:hypothetical protein
LRTRVVVTGLATMFLGSMVGGALFSPAPAGAVSREIVQLQDQVDQVLHGQQDLRSAMDANNAMLKVMIQQTSDAVNGLEREYEGAAEKRAGGAGQFRVADRGAGSTQSQGTADNLQDVQARVGKLSQQLTDIQNLLQSIDGKVSGSVPGAAPGGVPTSGAPGQPEPTDAGRPGTECGFVANPLPERAARFQRREERSGAAGIRRLHQELPKRRSSVECAVLSGRNCLYGQAIIRARSPNTTK